jgi:hypothetical protein
MVEPAWGRRLMMVIVKSDVAKFRGFVTTFSVRRSSSQGYQNRDKK